VRRQFFTIAAVSCAVLLYEVAITRVLSVVLWYHFAFLSVSLALLGLGTPGVWFHRFRPKAMAAGGEARDATPRALPAALLAAGITVPLSVIGVAKGIGALRAKDLAPGQFADADTAAFLSGDVLLAVVFLLIPFLCLGTAVCLLLLAAEGKRIGRMYGADLLGATLGAAIVVPLMHRIPTPTLIAGAGLLPLLCAPLIAPRLRWPTLAIAVLLVASLVQGDAYRLHATKKYVERELLHEKWTPTGRIAIFPDVFHLDDPAAAFAWGFGTEFPGKKVEQLWLEQDGSAGTPITKRTGDPDALSHLMYDVTSLAYQVRPAEHVCVIGAGGGRDILTAKLAGALSVDAVELNPHIVAAVTGPFAEYSGDPYHLPGVTPIVNEGRSHLARTDHRYDLIQISMVDSWAATAAGAFSLSENFLYTKGTIRDSWARLSGDGMIAYSRWFLDRHLVETARLVHLAAVAMQEEGVADPRAHLAVASAGAVATVLISKRAFGPEDIARLDQVCAERGFSRIWPPAERAPRFSMIQGLLTSGLGPATEMGLDLSPPTDDRPFFFQTVPVFGSINRDLVARLSVNEQSVVLLRRLILLVCGLALALFFVPMLLRGAERAPGFWPGSAFFAAIGLAFLFVEIAWIHRFILYLGHPSYATTVVLAAMLLGAGAGSMAAGRISAGAARMLLIALPVLVIAINALVSPVVSATLGAAFPVRVALTLAMLLPPSFLMGLPFPLGMVRFGEPNKPWFWAMNGAFSVVASVSSVALSMAVGYTAVALVGAAVYGAVAVLFATERGRVA
jgi:hypothetical protein